LRDSGLRNDQKPKEIKYNLRNDQKPKEIKYNLRNDQKPKEIKYNDQRKRTNRQTIIHKILHRKQKTEQHEPH
jgi:hypothetical protein